MRDVKDSLVLLSVVIALVLVGSIIAFGQDTITGDSTKIHRARKLYEGGTNWHAQDGPFEKTTRKNNVKVGKSTTVNWDRECNIGGIRCEGDDVYECNDGQYYYQQSCDNGCNNGMCIVEAKPGATRCLNNYVQIWTIAEGWRVTQRCGNGCSDGGCIGATVCESGESRCIEEYKQVCDEGIWLIKQRCNLGCGSGECIGEEPTPLDTALEEAQQEAQTESTNNIQPTEITQEQASQQVIPEEPVRLSMWQKTKIWFKNIFS